MNFGQNSKFRLLILLHFYLLTIFCQINIPNYTIIAYGISYPFLTKSTNYYPNTHFYLGDCTLISLSHFSVKSIFPNISPKVLQISNYFLSNPSKVTQVPISTINIALPICTMMIARWLAHFIFSVTVHILRRHNLPYWHIGRPYV